MDRPNLILNGTVNPDFSQGEADVAQLLFSYKLNPRTVLFLGYSDNATGGGFDSLPGPDRIAITRTDRMFFLKLGYAWQI